MAEFLEERLPVDIRMGATYADEYAIEVTQTANGSEYRRLVHGYPRRVFNVSYMKLTSDLWSGLLALYHRAYGMFAGFRVKCLDDYTTNSRTATPTAVDQLLAVVTAGSVYQLQVAYGAGGTPLSIGRPVRTIFKPVTGTTKVAIGALEQAVTTMWSVADTTGRITFAANKTRAVTGITQAASAVVTVGAHTFVTGESVYFSGVVGMTQINTLRGTITAIAATTITVAINSTAFTAYSSAGTVNTSPQTGELVYGGCEFDIPCRFNSRIDQIARTHELFETGEIEIIELLNP
ncbi:MAG: hypothetical protein B7Z31_00310 [Rhodobacterales bacterium 12-65-15]|nr:MAG: hypothetical protein B7Z31_00310 [Rhodobacterales bacterium 12-65-15]